MRYLRLCTGGRAHDFPALCTSREKEWRGHLAGTWLADYRGIAKQDAKGEWTYKNSQAKTDVNLGEGPPAETDTPSVLQRKWSDQRKAKTKQECSKRPSPSRVPLVIS